MNRSDIHLSHHNSNNNNEDDDYDDDDDEDADTDADKLTTLRTATKRSAAVRTKCFVDSFVEISHVPPSNTQTDFTPHSRK